MSVPSADAWPVDSTCPACIEDPERAAVLANAEATRGERLAEYSKFIPEEREAGAVGLHDDSALARLREVKAHWGPQNVFRRNHNIAV